ncbi:MULTISPECIES: M48 family metalloprotease [unclassified Massilia]|uniref:M48 family metalloprotease n=1 Tax=unclassified Massilia TaxID=2609279 RepID=UPI001B81A67E|nr:MULTISPECIES: M48 family metalloprotease [unclassified Massilia]MBQ5939343.1 M48 family metallopeptidase [Massilia sp. AB1]MBQ5961423.1 M48 family metallopeptidase [Massilia sp. ZL223]
MTVLALCTSAAFAIAAPAEPLQKPDSSRLPTLGDAARGDLSPVVERKLGEEIMRDIRRDRDYLDDEVILEYLNNFGNALVTVVPGARGETNADFQFFAVRDAALNAFALPGGFIGAHSGLIIAAQTESELAGVMSHEIGHVSQRHIARMLGQQKQDVLLPLAAMILAALAAKSSSDAAMGVLMGGQGLAIQRQLNFSRDAEREADRVGFQIMEKGGYDTTGIVAFFRRLQSASKLYGELPAGLSNLSSHPLTQERISDMQARIREIPKKQRVDSLDFHLVRARTRVLQDLSEQGRREAKRAFETQLKETHRQQQAGAQYGLAYLALRQGDLAGAQSWLDKARATVKPREGVFTTASNVGDGASIFAGLSIEIKMAQGQPPEVLQQAVQEAEQARQRFPLSRAIAHQYADVLVAADKLDEAARYLRDQVQQYREEPKLHDLLAKTYAKQGKIALQHMSLAESYVLAGALPAAVEQLNLARKASDVSFYDQAVIDARERELQARQKAEKEEEKER